MPRLLVDEIRSVGLIVDGAGDNPDATVELFKRRGDVDKQEGTALAEAQEERRRLRELVGPFREQMDTEGLLPSEQLDLLSRALARTEHGMTVETAEEALLEVLPDLRDGLKTELAASQGDETDTERLERLNETTEKGRDVTDDTESAKEAWVAKNRRDDETENEARARFWRTDEGKAIRKERITTPRTTQRDDLAERAARALRGKALSMHHEPEFWDVPLRKLRARVRHRYPAVTRLARSDGKIAKSAIDADVLRFLNEWAPQ